MALEDLVSDLSNFKGQSQYDDLDGQIKNGVDFIPNTDAPGFTPKTDLKSLYNKVKDGTVVAPNSGVVSNEKTRNPYGAQGEYLVANGIGIANPSHIISGDNILGVKVQPQFVTDFMTTPLADYNSRFSLSTPLGAGTKTLRVRKESFRKVEGESPFDKFVKPFSVETTKNIYGDSDYIKDLLKFDKDGKNTYPNVPSGMDGNGLFGTADFRKVANKGPFSGNDNHPLILRGIGNKWGIDANSGLLQTLDQTAGGFVRGAPGITGLVDRSLQDKVRIGRFMFTTNLGLSFIVKQFALQALNPTLESKIWNPASALSLTGVGQIVSGLVSTVTGGGVPSTSQIIQAATSAAVSAAFPIGHPERHIGGIKYEDVNPLDKLEGDKGLGKKIKSIPVVGNTLFDKINDKIDEVGGFSRLGAQASMEIAGVEIPLKDRMLMMNPNKYLFPISSAPMSVVDGVPKFTIEAGSGNGSAAKNDADKAESKLGGTFNNASSNNSGRATNGTSDRTKFHTSTYSELRRENRYEKDIKTPAVNQNTHMQNTEERRKEYKKINDNIGNPGGTTDTRTNAPRAVINEILGGGVKRGEGSSIISSAVDKVNIIPYGSDGNGDIPTDHQSTKDFIKFRFFDVVNKKFIIFRAILEGITDTITPEYSEERYIGRPDKLFTYQGVDRSLSFTFSIYPKTKQELPVLMEKLNYLIGLCYPSFTTGDRMVTPFIDLTLGDMFVSAPGILSSLTVTVEEQSTWEITDGLQFPHFIKAACEFRHIGKHVPVSTGRHYDLPFGLDEARQKQIDRFTSDKAFGFNQYPSRKEDFRKEIFKDLGQPNE